MLHIQQEIFLPAGKIKILLLYRKRDLPVTEFIEILSYLSASIEIDLILGDFNLKPEPYLSQEISEYEQLVTEPTHLGGRIVDHVYVKKSMLQHFSIAVNVKSIFFRDHEAIKIVITKKFQQRHISLM